MEIKVSKSEILKEVERRLSTESSIMPDKYDQLWVTTNKKELLNGYWIEGCESVVSLFKRYLDSASVNHSLDSYNKDDVLTIDATMPVRYNSLLDGSLNTDVKMMIACNIVYRWLNAILPDVSEKYNLEANGYMESVKGILTFRIDPQADMSSAETDNEEMSGSEVALSAPKEDDAEFKQLWECRCKPRFR